MYEENESNLYEDNEENIEQCEVCHRRLVRIRENYEAYGSEFTTYEWQCPNCG